MRRRVICHPGLFQPSPASSSWQEADIKPIVKDSRVIEDFARTPTASPSYADYGSERRFSVVLPPPSGDRSASPDPDLKWNTTAGDYGVVGRSAGDDSNDYGPSDDGTLAQVKLEPQESSGNSFKCPFCSMRFPHKQLREHHVTTVHIHRNRFACSHCNKTYAYGFHLQRHVSKMHVDQTM